MVSPYEVLQVDPDADDDEIDDAYRRRVKETHPDQGGSASEFRLVQLAYEEIQSGTYWTPAGQRRLDDVERQVRYEQSGGAVRDDAGEDGANGAGSRSHTGRGTSGGRRSHGPSRRDRVDASGRTRPARVEYVDYEVLADHGWDLDDPDLFERAGAADLSREEHGTIFVQPGQSILEAAEESGFDWPFSCRGGACANCAVAVVDGDVEMPHDTILPDELKERGIRLSCNGQPVEDDLKIVFNVKHLPDLEDLRLPPRPFVRAGGDE